MIVHNHRPVNGEFPPHLLDNGVTPTERHFVRNNGLVPERATQQDPQGWSLTIDGEVHNSLQLGLDELMQMPATTLQACIECGGNGRANFDPPVRGNPWDRGAIGCSEWTGVKLRDLLERAGLKDTAVYTAHYGADPQLGTAPPFSRGIPIDKAMASTLLAYEMNGEPLPLKHGYPLRALALGWTGANCVKWLKRITVLDKPYEGFFMDKVYRVFQKGQDPASGEIVTGIKLKSIITQPLPGEQRQAGRVVVLGAAYGGEERVEKVEVSPDNGVTWHAAEFLGPDEPFAWRHWQFVWQATRTGSHTLLSRATDSRGRRQPDPAGADRALALSVEGAASSFGHALAAAFRARGFAVASSAAFALRGLAFAAAFGLAALPAPQARQQRLRSSTSLKRKERYRTLSSE